MSDTIPGSNQAPPSRREAFPEDAHDPALGGTPAPPQTPGVPSVQPASAAAPVALDPAVAPTQPSSPAGATPASAVPSTPPAPDDQWQTGQSNISGEISKHKSFRLAKIALIVGTLLLLSAIVFVRYQQSAFRLDRVTVTVTAPTSVDAAQSVQVDVAYVNNNRVALSDSELRVYSPAGFQLDQLGPNMVMEGDYIKVALGTVLAHSGGKVTFSGHFNGATKTVGYTKAVLHYTPANGTIAYETTGQSTSTLQSSSLSIDIEAPLETAPGAKAEYVISYTNTADAPLTNIRLKVTYPEGFVYTDSNPKTSEGDAVWYLGTIAPHQTGKINTWGILNGSKGETKTVHVDAGIPQGDGNLGVYASGERTTKMVTSPLVIQQMVNGVVKMNGNSGQTLRYTISYRNDGPVALRNTIITFEMRSKVLDFSKIESDGGTFDSKTQTMTWKSSDIPKLANLLPGESGSFRISIPVVGQMSFQGDQDKNPTVVTLAKIDSPDVPNPTGANKTVGSNTLTLPINSTPTVSVRVAYQDSVLANTGPTPPVIGQETTYAVHWVVTNTTNDLKGVKVVGELAPNVRWIGPTSPESEHVTYDERTNKVTWDLGGLDSGAGSLRPAREVVFQLGINPAPNQVNSIMNLLPLMQSSVLTGVDTFTNESLTVPFQPKIVTPIN